MVSIILFTWLKPDLTNISPLQHLFVWQTLIENILWLVRTSTQNIDRGPVLYEMVIWVSEQRGLFIFWSSLREAKSSNDWFDRHKPQFHLSLAFSSSHYHQHRSSLNWISGFVLKWNMVHFSWMKISFTVLQWCTLESFSKIEIIYLPSCRLESKWEYWLQLVFKDTTQFQGSPWHCHKL